MLKLNNIRSGHEYYQEDNLKASITSNTLLGQQKDLKLGEKPRRPQGAKLKVPTKSYTKRELTQRYTELRKKIVLELYLRIARSENLAVQVAHQTIASVVGCCRETVVNFVSLAIARGDLEAWVPNRLRRDRAEALIYKVPSESPIYNSFRKTIASVGCLDSVSRNVFTGLMLYYVSNNISYLTSSYSQEIAYEDRAYRYFGDTRWRKVGYRRYASRPLRPPLPLYEKKNHEKETSMPFRQVNVLLQPDSEAAERAAPSSVLQRVAQQATFNELRAQAFLAKAGIDLSVFSGKVEVIPPPTPPARIESAELDGLMREWMASRAHDNKAVAELKDYCPIARWSPRTLELKAKIDEIKTRRAL